MRIKRTGFTLIELLVVIAVIAMLMSIMMPALAKVKEKGKQIICTTRLRTFGLSNLIYAEESEQYCIPYVVRTTSGTEQLWFRNSLFREICNLESKGSDRGKDATNNNTIPKEYSCPSDKRESYVSPYGEELQVSYGLNRTGVAITWANGNSIGYKLLKVKYPSGKLFMVDGSDYSVVRDYANYEEYWDELGDTTGDPWSRVAYRHSEGAGISFFDGHVECYKKEETFTVPDKDISDEEARAIDNKLWLPYEMD